MHVYILCRGIKHQFDRFINELSAKYLPYEIKEDGTAGLKKGKYVAQVHVRPIQLFEVVFPEECKDLMLNTLLNGGNGETQHKKHQKFIFMLRKILGVEKIPEYDKTVGIIPVERAGVEI